MPSLTRAWSLLLKGLFEVRDAARPVAACEMALIRLAYAADLPPTDKLVRDLMDGSNPPLEGGGRSADARQGDGSPTSNSRSGTNSGRGGAANPSPKNSSQHSNFSTLPQGEGGRLAVSPQATVISTPTLRTLEDIAALADPKSQLKVWIEHNIRLIKIEPGRLEFCPTGVVPPTLAADLAQKLKEWTGARWVVTLAREGGQPTLAEQKRATKAARHERVLQEPLVRAVLDRFPGAEIVAVRDVVPEEVAAPTPEDGEE
jgi:DNA polymerase-3 subunit gamma/tau